VADTDLGAMPLASLPATRRAILQTLKKVGQARAEELASALGITASAMRQHLTALTNDGLVAHEDVRGGRGRPKHLFHLAPAAEGLFPKTYSELTNELLDYVADADPELLEQVFERRRDRRIANAAARLAGKDFPDQVAELTRVLDEDGYLAEWIAMDDGSYRIVEHNCAILGVASRYGQACTAEIDFIRTVLPGAEINRVEHIMAGARRCAYEITPTPKPTPKSTPTQAPGRGSTRSG
jgi:DeoR family suf operon transcriptional repressor